MNEIVAQAKKEAKALSRMSNRMPPSKAKRARVRRLTQLLIQMLKVTK